MGNDLMERIEFQNGQFRVIRKRNNDVCRFAPGIDDSEGGTQKVILDDVDASLPGPG